MLSRLHRLFCFAVLFCALGLATAGAQTAQFDLQGPSLEVKVQRDSRTLPIAQVPSLREGDRLWLHPVLGEHESVHYLMVAIFLRGSTNPPPDNWFNKVEAWNKQVQDEGTYIVVPPGAEQAVVLFAPETGGDFSTLKSAVRGRPGAFVRATQDLEIASEDRQRIYTYLNALNAVQDPDKVKDESNTLARSLSLKLNQDCFTRPADQQANCLQQAQSAIVLDNGSSSTAQGLLNGPTSDLALQAGMTPSMSAGLYDPYIAAAFDIGRLLASFHSARFQYIPALSSDSGITMNLWLNAAPSFHNPKSVLVAALPPVREGKLPTLHPVDPRQVFCMQRTPLVLPVDGAPAIFSTAYAHDLTLHLQGKDGKSVDLPAQADAARGGFVVPTPVLENAGLGNSVEATVHGFWGFEPYTGPSFQLRGTHDTDWKIADADKNALVVGRDDQLHLRSGAAACVDQVSFSDAYGNAREASWKLDGADGIVATLPLKDVQPGSLIVSIKEFGASEPTNLRVSSFAEVGKYDAFTLHAGDADGVLTGTRLDGVASLELDGVKFTPGKLERKNATDSLALGAGSSADAVTSLSEGTKTIADLTLKDGRTVPVSVTVEAPRPAVTLLNKDVQLAPLPQPPPPIAMKLGAPDELPLDGKLTFALRAKSPAAFGKDESIEIATTDGLASITLSLPSGQLVLQDAQTVIGTLDPAKNLGASAFGPLRLRPIVADGTAGDWIPLATLVRLPTLQSYTCPAPEPAPAVAQNATPTIAPSASQTTPGTRAQTQPAIAPPCTLSGTGLYLLAAVAADAQFLNPVPVPEGFAANTLEVPRTAGPQLYAKLRDDPAVVNIVTLPPLPAARAIDRRSPPPPAGASTTRPSP